MANEEPKIDPQELEARKHVEQLMGPADPRYTGTTVSKSEQEAADDKAETLPTESSNPTPTAQEQGPIADPPTDVTETADLAQEQQEEAVAAMITEPLAPESGAEPTQEPPKAEAATEEDKATDAAVSDIMRSDADAALPEEPQEAVVMKSSFIERCKNTWLSWWGTPWKRYGTILAAATVVAVLLFVAPVRAAVLNAVGVRSSLLVHVFDGANNLPLQNAVVEVDGKTAKTNADGEAKITGIHVGNQDVKIHKLAFAAVNEKVRFGVRIVDLDDVTLKPVGAQITYVFTDYLSGKPIQDVSLKSGEATAQSDKKGKAVITIEPSSTKDATITASKEGYRTDVLQIPTDLSATTDYKLVPGAHAIYVSKQSGKYDVYKMYIDGKDKAVLMAGTGLETQPPVVLPSPDGKKVAVVSTRDDKRNEDGYLLTALNIVDVSSGEAVALEHAEQVVLIGWQGNTLVYQQTVAGASAANSSRQKIIAYDLSDTKRFQLANANYFIGQQLIGNILYYAVSSTDPNAKTTFGYVNIDGSGQKRLYSGQVWSLLRTDYDNMKLQTPDKWYEYTVGASALASTTPVGDYTSRFYVDSPDTKESMWVDARDTNGVLLVRDISSGTEREVLKQKNMQAPLYWLNDSSVVYRVAGSSEIADYAVNVQGGQAKKLADVSLSSVR